MLVALAHVIAVSKTATTAKDFAAWDFMMRLIACRPYRLDSWGDGAPVGGWPLFGRGVGLGSQDRCLRMR